MSLGVVSRFLLRPYETIFVYRRIHLPICFFLNSLWRLWCTAGAGAQRCEQRLFFWDLRGRSLIGRGLYLSSHALQRQCYKLLGKNGIEDDCGNNDEDKDDGGDDDDNKDDGGDDEDDEDDKGEGDDNGHDDDSGNVEDDDGDNDNDNGDDDDGGGVSDEGLLDRDQWLRGRGLMVTSCPLQSTFFSPLVVNGWLAGFALFISLDHA